jgi:hypothetical protein
MRRLAAFSVVIFSALVFATTAIAGVVGYVAAVAPLAELQTANGTIDIVEGTQISQGDVVKTGRNGSVQLIFADDTRIVVGPGSQLVIDDILMKTSNRASRFSVNALAGTFRFITGQSEKQAYEIVTPTATMAVRGTIFDFHVEHNRLTSVVLFEGKVILCTLSGECEEMEDLCSLSRTERSRINVLFFYGEDRNSELREDFPYVVNQRPLREDFRAPIESCGDISAPPAPPPSPPVSPPPPPPSPNPAPPPPPPPATESAPAPVEPDPNYQPGNSGGQSNGAGDPVSDHQQGWGTCNGQGWIKGKKKGVNTLPDKCLS